MHVLLSGVLFNCEFIVVSHALNTHVEGSIHPCMYEVKVHQKCFCISVGISKQSIGYSQEMLKDEVSLHSTHNKKSQYHVCAE